MIEDQLAAPDREGGDQDAAAPLCGLVDDARQFLARVLVAMRAVAVGRLHDQEVGALHLMGRQHEGFVGPPQIAGEDEALALGLDLQNGRAQDVSRPSQRELNAG